MTMRHKKLTYIALVGIILLFFSLSACSGKEEIPQPASAIPISWQINSVSTLKNRSLVDYNQLQAACTAGDGNESIGVWGEYTQNSDAGSVTTTQFDAVPLTYGEKEDGTTNNPYSFWNYPGEPKFWKLGANYLFRACFPQARMMSLMTEITPAILQGTVNTAEIQEDLLVASAYIDTSSADLSKPVPLNLQHILAALSFGVQAEEGYDPVNDAVTSCWLQNQSDANDLFATSGYLVYSGNESSTIVWYPYESNSTPMYVWEHNGGLTFDSEGKTLLYTDNIANKYASNDGWLLVIPQAVKTKSLHFCYTLKNAPGKVFTNEIPTIEYRPGYKYNYVLTISGADATLALTIAPWNQLDSSHNIDL